MKRLGWGSEVAATYTKEFRCLLRDQHTVIYSVVIPVFLYPALVWGFIQILTYARAIQDRVVSTVSVAGDASAARLREHLESVPKLRLVEAKPGDAAAMERSPRPRGGLGTAAPETSGGPGEAARATLAGDAIDAFVHVERSALAGNELAGGMEVSILFNSALDASVKARDRLVEAIEGFRRERLLSLARELGEDEEFVAPLAVTAIDIASREEFSQYMASLILPLLMLIMTALGALYPALDVTVGEKERGCLETTLIAPVGRAAIVVGKYLAVVTFALVAFLLNFTSMVFTLFHQGSVLRLEPFVLEWSSGLIILAAALLLSAFLSAIMMFLAFQARTFKEGQSYVMPVYLLAVIPTLVVASPEVTFDVRMALVPLVNIALLFRGALQGSLQTGIAVVSLGSAVLYAAIVLAFAVRYLERREVIAERAGRGLFSWRRRTARSSARTPPRIPDPARNDR